MWLILLANFIVCSCRLELYFNMLNRCSINYFGSGDLILSGLPQKLKIHLVMLEGISLSHMSM